MKTIVKICFVAILTSSLFTSCAVRGGFVIHERPVEPVYVRPVVPYQGAVWIPGEWEWRGGRYVYVNGHYVRAYNRVWIAGHWRPVANGYVWDRGHWR